MNLRALALAATAALALLVASVPCRAQYDERILDFRSRIVILEDGSMTVTETITVNAMGWEIKRGIFRDLWTRYEDPLGNDFRVDYEFTQVLRNGASEPWHTEYRGDSVRLYIGDANVYIPQGRHVYTITYQTERQVGFFQDYDEIYWNVTGTNWSFTIDRAEVVIVLPPGATVSQWAAYTGAWGETGHNYVQDLDPDGNIRITTTRPLYAREGLTVAVAWPKGFVAEPSRGQKFAFLLQDNLYLVIGLAGLLLLWCWLLTAWFFVGRDPDKGVIMPLYAPPPNMSPAEVRFVRRMNFDNKCFAAALVDMAVKGHALIKEKSKGDYTVERVDSPIRELSADEAVVKEKLLGGKKSLRLKNTNHVKIRGAINELRVALKKSCQNSLFYRNTGWMVPGWIIAVATFLAAMFSVREGLLQGLMALFFSVWFGLGLFLFLSWFRGVSLPGRSAPGNTLQKVMTLIFSLVLIFMSLIFLKTMIMAEGSPLLFQFLPLLLLGTLVLFRFLIKAPTTLGRQVMDQIDGFRMYLDTAEQTDMALRNPPDRTPELFEKYLPYALALDVEVGWCEQFAHILQSAAAEPGDYHPTWYHGSNWDRLGAMGVASGLGASLNSAITSSSASPSSSSGSGGGGFSGGGGGGGGGGGW